MDRIATVLESRRAATVEPGKIAGVLSPKGGCGATSIACYLSAAMQLAAPSARILVADLDYQSPAAHHIFRPECGARVRPPKQRRRRVRGGPPLEYYVMARIRHARSRRASICWCRPRTAPAPTPSRPSRAMAGGEPLSVSSAASIRWILADLGRHLNPANWTVLQNIDELFIVTAPDVLALYPDAVGAANALQPGLRKEPGEDHPQPKSEQPAGFLGGEYPADVRDARYSGLCPTIMRSTNCRGTASNFPRKRPSAAPLQKWPRASSDRGGASPAEGRKAA